MGLAWRRDLVQRATRQTAAERLVDRRDAEGKDTRTVLDPGAPLQNLQTLTKLFDHMQASGDTTLFG
jgi:hypothetical protein